MYDDRDALQLFHRAYRVGIGRLSGATSRGVYLPPFDFQYHEHSTGKCLRIFIVDPGDNEILEIANLDYFVGQPSPRHYHFDKGPWDQALQQTLEDINHNVYGLEQCDADVKRLEQEKQQEQRQKKLEKFGRLFK